MHGVSSPLQSTYGMEYIICKEMGWSVADMYSAPAGMIDEILVRINAQQKWTAQREKMDASRNKPRLPTKRR